MVKIGTEEFAPLDNVELCYQRFGNENDPVIILIMGLATQMIHWDDNFCCQLAVRGFHVIRFDNRDIGLSTKLEGHKAPGLTAMLAYQWFNKPLKVAYDLNDMANDTLQLLDHLEIDQAHFVGASMGGMIAQCIAINSPNRVKSLTSIMSTTGNRSLPKPKASVTMQLIKPVPHERQAYVKHALDMWQLFHGSHFPFDRARVAKTLEKSHKRCFYRPGVKRQMSAIVASPDRTTALGELKMPTLVIHGDADPLVPVECGYATTKALPNAKQRIFEGMGHTLPEQLWADMIAEISEIAS